MDLMKVWTKQHLDSLRYILTSPIWNYLENEFLIAAISNPEYMYHLIQPEHNSPNKFEPISLQLMEHTAARNENLG